MKGKWDEIRISFDTASTNKVSKKGRNNLHTTPSVINIIEPDSARNISPGCKVIVAMCDSSPSILDAAVKSIYLVGRLLLFSSLLMFCGKLFEESDGGTRCRSVVFVAIELDGRNEYICGCCWTDAAAAATDQL